LLAGLVAAAMLGLSLIIHTGEAIDRARGTDAPLIPFDTASRTLTGPPDAAHEGWRVISRPAPVRDIAVFGDRIYAATDGGLWILDKHGNTQALLTALDGLAQGRVRSVEAMGDAVLAASEHGLTLIRGDTANRFAFSNPDIGRAVHVTTGGTAHDRLLWLCEDGGIYSWDPSGVRSEAAVEAESPRYLIDDAPDILAATSRDGVIRVHAGAPAKIDLGPERGRDEVNQALLSGRSLFVASATGLFEVDLQGVHSRISDRFVTCVELLEPDVFAGTISGELIRVGDQQPEARLDAPIRCLEAWGDRLLIGTDLGILVRESDGTIQALAAVQPGDYPAENHVAALAHIGGQKVLTGGFDHGMELVHLSGVRDPHFEPYGPAGINGVNRLAADLDTAGVWIAHTAGVFQTDLEGGVIRELTREDGLIHDNVADVLITPSEPGGQSVVRFATAAGLSRLDGGTIRSIYHLHGLVNNHVYTLAGLSDKKVLVGTLGGLNEVSDLKVLSSHTRESGGLRSAWITALLPLDDGILVGTYGGGLSLYREEGVVELDSAHADAEVNFNAMARAGGFLLVGTLRHGLLVGRDPDTWRSLTDGLPSPNVTAVQPLGDRILLGTDAGLLLLPLEHLNRLFEN